MITGIEIERFRGIREGRLEGLTPLTVLVGPNGSGKSTVLDALLIGGGPLTGHAIRRAVQRRASLVSGAPWLAYGRDSNHPTKVVVRSEQAAKRVEFIVEGSVPAEPVVAYRAASGDAAVDGRLDFGDGPRARPQFETHCALAGVEAVRVVEAATDDLSVLADLFDRIQGSPGHSFVVDSLRQVAGEAATLEIGSDRGRAILKLNNGQHSVPVDLCGDGLRSLLLLCLELAAFPLGTVLLEEPEARQHPKAIWQTAAVLRWAVAQGCQVIASTHSLEFLDAMLDALDEPDLGLLSVHQLRLRPEGKLSTGDLPGDCVARLRNNIDEELR